MLGVGIGMSLWESVNIRMAPTAALGRTVDSHTSEESVSFVADLVASQPEGREIHVILDNLSAHKSKRVRSS